MAAGSVMLLPRGFRFSPSDEELVVRYLRPRAVGEPLPCAVIVDADIQQHDPWDLVPESAKEKYFFSRKEMKYPGSRRVNRAAGHGYWRATGPETPVYSKPGGGGNPVLVGMKRALVFYRGQAPARERTDWVMHEYRLAGAGLTPCRVMRRANRNNSVPPCGCTAAATEKKNGPHGSALHAVLARAPLVPVMVYPDPSWVICCIYKKKRAPPRVIIEVTTTNAGEGAAGPFIDFLGQAHREPSPTPSCASVTPLVKEEEDGASGGDKKAGTGEGN